ncbi:hypothetical protein [Hyalangium sp.]|uniref:hypothetical protein n=1 Tax=Hyalangium sp. TaxID=2028555 RepID=UPI002D439612|nr:hypothetical protein [Hyalangium sp.]HYI02509.1 hypothetical protein [Hyalangium sp.]
MQLSLLASGVVTLAEPDDAFGSGLRIEALAQIGPHIAVGPKDGRQLTLGIGTRLFW